MTTKRYNPLNDFLFLKVMGEKGDEEQLLAFLNAVLGRTGDKKIETVEILEDRIITPEFLGDKASVLDVRARTEDGTRLNIEVQLRNVGDMDRRSLFYWSREYTKQLKAGEDYIELPNVIAINIIDFDYKKTKNFHSCYHLWEDTDKDQLLTDALEIRFIDMVKFRKMCNNIERGESFLENPLHRWLTFFDKSSPNELVEEVVKMDMAIQKAHNRIDHVIQDESALRAYEMREKAILDWNSAVGYHTRETARETAREIARKMRAKNVSINEIIDYTGLTVKQIEDL